MATLQITNQVRDFDDWKEAFDSYERFRSDHGVRRYRVLRSVADPQQVVVHLDFDTDEHATEFLPRLARIWETPRSHAQLAAHSQPELLTLVTDRTLEAAPTRG
jgi:hypothetical protein